MLRRLSDTHGRGRKDGRLLASTLSFPEVQATQSTVGVGEGEGASLLGEASCIFLYLSTKSHKRWTVSRLHTAPDMGSRSREAPLINERETASTYHINTANQIHIFFSYIKDINSEKGLYCIYHHRPVFFRNFGK